MGGDEPRLHSGLVADVSARHDRALLELASQDEADILRRIQRGDRHAYGVLYERYVAGARRVARAVLRSNTDVDDAVAEGFAAAFAAIRRGKGPRDCFGPYIKSCVRHECFRLMKRAGRCPVTATDADEPDSDDVDEFGRLDEQGVVKEAFEALSPRMRSVLWYSEVEGLSHAEIADITGGSPNAVAALAMRARRELSTHYLQAHVGTTVATAAECHQVRSRLADIVRGTASRRVSTKTAAHLARCPGCASAQTELVAVNSRLRSTPLAAILTGLGAPTLLRVGWKARLLGLLSLPAANLTAVTTLVVLSAIGPAPAAAVPPPADRAPVVVHAGSVGPDVINDIELAADRVPAATGPSPDDQRPNQAVVGEVRQPGMTADFEPPGAPTRPDVVTPTVATTTPPAPATTIVVAVPGTLPLGDPSIPVVTVPAVGIDIGADGTDVDIDVPGVNEVLPVDVTVPLPPVDVDVTLPPTPPVPAPVVTVPSIDLGAGTSVGTGPTGVSTGVDLVGQEVGAAIDLDDGIDVGVGLGPACVPVLGRNC